MEPCHPAALTSVGGHRSLRAMDTLKILLIATVALLCGGLVVSVKRMNQQVQATPAEEMEALRMQLREMEQEMERLKLDKERRMLREEVNKPSPTDPVTRQEVAETKTDLEERLAQLEEETKAAKEDAERAEAEAGFLTERYAEDRNKAARRARVINDAMQVATVKEWVEDPNFGGFAVLQIERADNVQPGVVLAIRRNSGILGKLKVGEVTAEGAVANPVTAFTEVKPQPGDELILNEIVDLAN